MVEPRCLGLLVEHTGGGPHTQSYYKIERLSGRSYGREWAARNSKKKNKKTMVPDSIVCGSMARFEDADPTIESLDDSRTKFI